MLVSDVQQSDSVIPICVPILSQILFPCRLLHYSELSSLCYIVCPCVAQGLFNLWSLVMSLKVCISLLIILCHFLEHFTHTCTHTVEDNCSNTRQKKNFLKKNIDSNSFAFWKNVSFTVSLIVFFFHSFDFTSRRSTIYCFVFCIYHSPLNYYKLFFQFSFSQFGNLVSWIFLAVISTLYSL